MEIRSYRAFLRETKLQGAVFRGQTRDYGNLTPSLYRESVDVNVDSLADLASKYYLEIHDRIYQLKHRAALYEDGLESANYPDFSFLGAYGNDDDTGIPIRMEPPIHRTLLELNAFPGSDAEWELAELEAADEVRNWGSFKQEAQFIKRYDEPAYALARLQLPR